MWEEEGKGKRNDGRVPRGWVHLHLPKLLLGGTIHFFHTLVFYLKTDHLPLHIDPSVVHFPKQGIARTCPMFISSVGVFALQ